MNIDQVNRLLYREHKGLVNGEPILEPLSISEKEFITSLLDHQKSRIRWLAANLLGKERHERSIHQLHVSLQDSHWLVRLHCAKALGRIQSHESIAPLRASINDECPFVRRRVVTALAEFVGHTEVAEDLIKALRDEDYQVRIRAIHGLRNFSNLEITEAIKEVAEDRNPQVSWCAFHVLGQVGKNGTYCLIELLHKDRPELRYRALRMLALNPTRSNYRAIKNMLKDPSEDIRIAADQSLKAMKRSLHWWNTL
jgi:HEAT repeat protein